MSTTESTMRIEYDPALPITDRHDEIAAALRDHQVVVVAGETGSGKTTQLPKIAYELGRRAIAHTQPRRIAARSVAKRIADECGVELGTEVGYAVRFDDQRGDAITLLTDGLLLAELSHDRELSRYDTIIIDEAHERSLAIDFLLGYLVQLLPRRPDLKVVITSATIAVERFAEMFGGAPIIEVSGRTFPIEMRYRPFVEREDGDPLQAIADAITELPREGDVLVFLSGEREIRDTAEHLQGKKWPRTEILPLYGRLSTQDQQKIFAAPSGGRRIVLATNVAETSLTVPGIRYVVDPGFARVSRYSQRLKVQRLPIEPVSQASARQRAGRCGRVAEGICIRLYSEEDYESRPEFTDPEIQRTNLASVLLQMADLELGDVKSFPFLDKPDSRAVGDGVVLLTELGAIVHGRDGTPRLTRLGRTLARLPLDPRMARMVLAADRLGCLADVLVIVSALSIQDPRERPLEHQQAADEKHSRFREPDSDFLSYLTLWTYLREQRDLMSHSAFRRMCRDEFLHYLRIREWHDVHSQLRRTVKELGMKPGRNGADPDAVHQALLHGLLSHVGLREGDTREYLGARNAKFAIFPGSGLAKKPPRLVMAGELVETSRLWARDVAKIQPEWAEKAGEHLVKRSYSEPHWSTKRGAVMARERVSLYGVPLVADRLVQYGKVDPVVSRELFIRHALVQGEWRTHHRFFERNRAFLDEVGELEDRLRRRGLRVDDETLFAFYDERVPADVVSARHFDAWWKKAKLEQPELLTFDPSMLLADDVDVDVDELYPTEWFSDGAAYPLTYRFEPGVVEDGVTVDIPLERLLQVSEGEFAWGVPGQRTELVAALIRSLPKQLRRQLVPAPQHAATLAPALDPADGDLGTALARQVRLQTGVVVEPSDFDWSSLPPHLRMTYRVVEDGDELARGDSLDELRVRLRDHLRADLTETAKAEERTGITRWDVGTIERAITAGQVTGYPALVDEGAQAGVALRVLETEGEQRAAMVKAQARLLSYVVATPVPQLGRTLDVRTKLLLSTGPYADAAAVIEDCFLAALDELVVRHGGPAWDEAEFELLREQVRADVFDVAEQVLRGVVQTLQKLGDVVPVTGTSDAAEDAKVQLSWLLYPGFVRDAGLTHVRRMPLYLEAMRRLLTAGTHPHLPDVQDLEARFYAISDRLRPWQRQEPDVRHARWALEELRIGLWAQDLRTAHPISLKRMTKLLDAIESR
ncbi:ATP-dependent RNA helicase HrpA [Aeromicrobium massiliense]|uniref:ATP-dependent RNA helicase HrpA n=1 Tax=Aeromicrobium massiliense TaxID=1464554 RepID=UPI000A6D3C2E|nr:ATP-dependent RNA helicase HrpA [Aeromicrobium massiliense]